MATTLLKKHKDAVKQCEETRRAAMESGDPSPIGPLLSDDFLYVHASSGKPEDKAAYLARLATGKAGYTSVEMRDTAWRFYGNNALMTGVIAVRATREGKKVARFYRCSILWVLKRLRWQLVLWHNTRMPD
jgi:ketosteroid isomerase-like protein